jgi:hypothetical protein
MGRNKKLGKLKLGTTPSTVTPNDFKNNPKMVD